MNFIESNIFKLDDEEEALNQKIIQLNKIKPYIPETASSAEKRIHAFLEQQDIFAIDIKSVIDD